MTESLRTPNQLPLCGTRLIEASAGTGKTYTIAALYVRLILGQRGQAADADGQQRVLLPPDILVVTFTDAATKELRERIRHRLNQAAQFFRAPHDAAADEFLTELRQQYDQDQWLGCARRLEVAARWMDEAAVYTIHGWCHRMLQQHAFDSGSLFQQEVQTDDYRLLHEVVRDYWRTFFYPLSEALCLRITGFVESPEDLIRLLNPLLALHEAEGLQFDDDLGACFDAWEKWHDERARLEAAARKAWRDDRANLDALLRQASAEGWLNKGTYKPDKLPDQLASIAGWAEYGASVTDKALNKLLDKFRQTQLQAALVKAHQDKLQKLKHPAFTAIDELYNHQAKESDIRIQCAITKHALHWVKQRYIDEKRRLARLTFDDMLVRLDAALQGPQGERLADAIRQQYPVALIDEFQDTDPIQYRIFSTLYAVAESSNHQGLACFMIGDPKQAIYSFRGADIYTYLQAHQATRGRHYTLETNFRSTKKMVEAVNQVFRFADQHEKGAFRFKQNTDNPLPFIAVNAQGRDEDWVIDGKEVPALTLWHWETEPVSQSAYREQMAEATATEIVRLLLWAQQGKTGFRSGKTKQTIRPLQPSDIAILVRTGSEAKVMRAALAKRQLRSVYLSERDSIFDTPEARDVLRWLHALAEPQQERNVRAALATATLGWSQAALHRLTVDERAWEEHLERFAAYRLRWRQFGILPALRQLINDYGLARRLAENEGERILTNVLHLAEWLQQISGQLEGEQALIRQFAEAIEIGDTVRGDDRIIRLESDADLIQIITIHKSKGLEYPLVFLPFVCGFREVDSKYVKFYRYHNAQQRLCVDLTQDDSCRAANDEERLQEDLRLLYVGMTRAQYACWLGVAPVKSGNIKSCQLEKSAIGSVLGWMAGQSANALRGGLDKLRGGIDAITVEPLPKPQETPYRAPSASASREKARIMSTRIVSDWWIASYSALAVANKTLPDEPMTERLAEPETPLDAQRQDEAESATFPVVGIARGVHAWPRGVETGLLIHDLLEQCAQAGFATVRANRDLAMALIQQRFGGAWKEYHDALLTQLYHWLDQPLLEQGSMTLAQLKTTAYQAEMEFLIGAETVDVAALDRLVSRYLFPGRDRPRLLPGAINGLLKGFIDLVFVHEERYYLIDYKFNSLGVDDQAYTKEAMIAAALHKRYDVQYALYWLALHRLLKSRLGERYAIARHLGGGLYWFLRGAAGPAGGRLWMPTPIALIEALDQRFAGWKQEHDAA